MLGKVSGARAPAIPPRQRIEKACDHCRRRKTKCDGEATCGACTVTGLRCSYDSRKNVPRGKGSYVTYLEDEVGRLERLLSETDGHLFSSTKPSERKGTQATTVAVAKSETANSRTPEDSVIGSKHDEKSSLLAYAPLEASEQHEPRSDHEYAGLSTLRRLRVLCSQMAGLLQDEDASGARLMMAMDRDLSPKLSNRDLPLTQLEVSRYITIAFAEALSPWPFLDLDFIINCNTSRLYADDFVANENSLDSLMLLYMVIALGMRYEQKEPKGPLAQEEGPDLGGLRFYLGATEVVNTSNCGRNLESLQVMVCMAIYALSAGALSSSLTYSRAAGAAAMRLGIHERTESTPALETAKRRRIWSTVRMLDAYTTSALGYCRDVQIDDFDEDRFPQTSVWDSDHQLQLCNAHSGLTDILSLVVQVGDARWKTTRMDGSPILPVERIEDLRMHLERWVLENSLQLYPLTPEPWVRLRITLELLAGYTDMLICSRFMHTFAQPRDGKNGHAFRLARACVEAAIKTVKILESLQVRTVLMEACPCVLPSLTLASVTLLVAKFGDESQLPPEVREEVAAARSAARRLLHDLSRESAAAADCLESLKDLFQMA